MVTYLRISGKLALLIIVLCIYQCIIDTQEIN